MAENVLAKFPIKRNKPVGIDRNSRIYLCEEKSTGQQLLLQIASELEHNGDLDRAAYVLRELKRFSDLLEAEYAKSSPGKLLNYDRLFPKLIDSFVSDEQGKRRINILAFKNVDDPTLFVPLSNLTNRDGVRLDLPSSAWIMGRLLKLLDFTHRLGVAVRLLSGNNVLIVPESHFAVVFDWSDAQFFPNGVPTEQRQQEIADAARTVFTAIGGHAVLLSYPYDTQGADVYVELLRSFATYQYDDASTAHRQFYQVVYGLFGHGFRETNLLPL